MADNNNGVPEPAETGTETETALPEVPLNRAQRRALATGKKGSGNKPDMPHQSGMRGPSHPGAPQAPPARMQTRGSNRGK